VLYVYREKKWHGTRVHLKAATKSERQQNMIKRSSEQVMCRYLPRNESREAGNKIKEVNCGMSYNHHQVRNEKLVFNARETGQMSAREKGDRHVAAADS